MHATDIRQFRCSNCCSPHVFWRDDNDDEIAYFSVRWKTKNLV